MLARDTKIGIRETRLLYARPVKSREEEMRSNPDRGLLENGDPLNQLAKKHLNQVKSDADPSVLYCLQLMEWGLDNVVEARDSRLRNTLENLIGSNHNQKESCRFLKLAEDGEEYDPVPNLEEVEGPEDLAWQLLDLLDSKVNLHMPDYPRARILP